jgi:hypothetical protein
MTLISLILCYLVSIVLSIVGLGHKAYDRVVHHKVLDASGPRKDVTNTTHPCLQEKEQRKTNLGGFNTHRKEKRTANWNR